MPPKLTKAKAPKTTPENLRVLELRVHNFYAITSAVIFPDPAVVEVTGDNGAGKSAIFDALAYACEGAATLGRCAIHRGADYLKVFLRLGNDDGAEILITRKTDEMGTGVLITDAAGNKWPDGERMLKALYSALTFDPVAFALMDEAKQWEVVAQLAGITESLKAAKLDVKNVYDRRRGVNNELETAQAKLANMPVVADDLQRVAVAGVAAELADLEEIGRQRFKVSHNLEIAKREEGRLSLLEVELRGRLEAARTQLIDVRDIIAGTELVLAKPVDDPAPLRVKLQNSETINRQCDQRDARDAHLVEVARLITQSERMTVDLEKKRQAVVDVVAGAVMPIPGLGIADDYVTFGGLPLANASTGELQRICYAIGKALAPGLKVVLVRDAALMVPERREALYADARRDKVQIWAEISDASGKNGIFIKDGTVGAVNGVAVVS